MKSTGYRDRRKKKKTIADLYDEVASIAKTEHGIQKTVISWKSKFRRLKRDYADYLYMIKMSGRSGDDDDLYDTPAFFGEIHESCNDSGMHSTPRASCLESVDKAQTSTRKKKTRDR